MRHSVYLLPILSTDQLDIKFKVNKINVEIVIKSEPSLMISIGRQSKNPLKRKKLPLGSSFKKSGHKRDTQILPFFDLLGILPKIQFILAIVHSLLQPFDSQYKN